MKVRVVTFHHISTSRKETKLYPGISTPRITFILLILALKAFRYKFCLFQELPVYTNRRCVVLNFDDAYQSVFTTAFPILSFLGIKAHICITGESLTGPVRANKLTLMDDKAALSVQQRGWDYINHTMNHTVLVNKTSDILQQEINRPVIAFRDAGIRLNPDFFCLPEGKCDDNADRFIHAAGYQYILTTEENTWDIEAPSMKVPRINISSQPLWYAFYKVVFKYRGGKHTQAEKPRIAEAT